MGAVYNVRFKIKVNDTKGFIDKGRGFIETYSANFNLDKQKRIGNDTDSIKGILGIIFVDRGGCLYSYEDKDGLICIDSSFDASYGWYFVMENFFKAVADTLGEGELSIQDDEGTTVSILADDGSIEVR